VTVLYSLTGDDGDENIAGCQEVICFGGVTWKPEDAQSQERK
jgi:hypothetical protein